MEHAAEGGAMREFKERGVWKVTPKGFAVYVSPLFFLLFFSCFGFRVSKLTELARFGISFAFLFPKARPVHLDQRHLLSRAAQTLLSAGESAFAGWVDLPRPIAGHG